jgi:hypothetical protein
MGHEAESFSESDRYPYATSRLHIINRPPGKQLLRNYKVAQEQPGSSLLAFFMTPSIPNLHRQSRRHFLKRRNLSTRLFAMLGFTKR